MRMYRALALAITLAVGSWPRVALALEDSDKESVRILANDADSEFEAGRYEAAREKFMRAYGIAKVPTLAVLAAQTNEKLGHLVAAYELYRQALDLQPNDLWKGDVQQQAQKEAEARLSKLQPRIPRLTVIIDGAGTSDVSVRIDNTQVPGALLGVERLTDPGQHQIVGNRGGEEVRQSIALNEGEKRQATLQFHGTVPPPATVGSIATNQPSAGLPGSSAAQPERAPIEAQPGTTSAPPSAPVDTGSSKRTLGWIGVGVGAASLTLGATTGLFVALKYGALHPECPDNNCLGQHNSEVSTYNTMRTLSVAGFAVGGVATAMGITVLAWTPKDNAQPQIGLQLLPGAAGLGGSF